MPNPMGHINQNQRSEVVEWPTYQWKTVLYPWLCLLHVSFIDRRASCATKSAPQKHLTIKDMFGWSRMHQLGTILQILKFMRDPLLLQRNLPMKKLPRFWSEFGRTSLPAPPYLTKALEGHKWGGTCWGSFIQLPLSLKKVHLEYCQYKSE